MKFTEEQLRKAVIDAGNASFRDGRSFVEHVIEKLNKPEFDPDANQIVYNRSKGRFTRAILCDPEDALRPQTLDEHGPDVRAMQEALIKLDGIFPISGSHHSIIIKALKHRIPE